MIQEALSRLNNNDVVAIPTETVYGLAARIDSSVGIKKIFQLKHRPFFDPLIVHVSSLEMAKSLCQQWPPLAEALAKHFWPGPLTLVLPKASHIDPLITSGLQTVGLRMPNHPMTLDLIRQLNVPLAAPSANQFGKTSPTTAQHVRSEFSAGLLILDGGPCQVGIESTILEIRNSELLLLRKGSVLQSEIEAFLKEQQIPFQFIRDLNPEKIKAAGQVRHHYMPKIPLVLIPYSESEPDTDSIEKHLSEIASKLLLLPDEVEGVKLTKPHQKIQYPKELLLPNLATEACRCLYSELRTNAESGADLLFFKIKPVHKTLEWAPIMDRLQRAASLIL